MIIYGITIGDIKGDTRSLDYSSCDVANRNELGISKQGESQFVGLGFRVHNIICLARTRNRPLTLSIESSKWSMVIGADLYKVSDSHTDRIGFSS